MYINQNSKSQLCTFLVLTFDRFKAFQETAGHVRLVFDSVRHGAILRKTSSSTLTSHYVVAPAHADADAFAADTPVNVEPEEYSSRS